VSSKSPAIERLLAKAFGVGQPAPSLSVKNKNSAIDQEHEQEQESLSCGSSFLCPSCFVIILTSDL